MTKPRKYIRGKKLTQRRARPQQIGDLVQAITKKPLRKRGFVKQEIVTQWRTIVGNLLADHTLPMQMSFPPAFTGKSEATLSVQAAPGFALELQHLEEKVVERINSYFGYRALSRLHIFQAPLPPIRRRIQRKPAHAPSAKLGEATKLSLDGIRDPMLAQALLKLAQTLSCSQQDSGQSESLET